MDGDGDNPNENSDAGREAISDRLRIVLAQLKAFTDALEELDSDRLN